MVVGSRKAHVEGGVLEPLECVAEVSKTGD